MRDTPMIINTDKIRFRNMMTGYIGVYGTQDNPYSSDYDVRTADEAENMASSLVGIAKNCKTKPINYVRYCVTFDLAKLIYATNL